MKSWNSIILCLLMVTTSCNQIPEPSPVNYELYVSDRDQYPKFSPDGEHIVYYHLNAESPDSEDYPTGLYIIDKNGGNRKLVLKGIHLNPTWSPDGQWIAFSTQGELQKCKTNGDSLMTFQNDNPFQGNFFFYPDWSSDGEEILFDRAENIEGESNLFSMKSDFTSARPIFGNIVIGGRDPELNLIRNRIVYIKVSREWDFWRVFSMDTTGNDDVLLTDNDKDNRSPSWSSDGQRIVWAMNVRLHIMDSDGSNVTPLTYGADPSWSVMDKIVFSHANQDYTKEVLYVINPDGSNKRQLTF